MIKGLFSILLFSISAYATIPLNFETKLREEKSASTSSNKNIVYDCLSPEWNTDILSKKSTCESSSPWTWTIVSVGRAALSSSDSYEAFCFGDTNGNSVYDAEETGLSQGMCDVNAVQYSGSLTPINFEEQGENQLQMQYDGGAFGVNVDSRAVVVKVPLVGTSWLLTYNSAWTNGYKIASQLKIPLLANPYPAATIDGHLLLRYGDGRVDDIPFTPINGLTHTFIWDGKDFAGEEQFRPVHIDRRVYYNTTGSYPAYKEVLGMNLGNYISNRFGLSGWNITPFHFLDRVKGRIWKGDGTIEIVPYEQISNGNYRAISKNGKEIYFFSTSGAHLSTRSLLNGRTIYTMSYSGGLLHKITDAYGNVTQFQRSGGVLTSIVAPFGNTTSVTVSGKHITQITNPANESYNMVYTNDILTSLQNPLGNTSTFTYDTLGLLTKAQGPHGDFFDVSRPNPAVRTFNVESALGRESVITVNGAITTEALPAGNSRLSQNDLYQEKFNYLNEFYETQYVDDPVWPGLGRLPSVFKHKVDTLTNGYEATYSKSVNLNNPSDRFTVASTSEQCTIGSSVYSKTFNAGLGRYISTTPEGTTVTTLINSEEQPTSVTLGVDTPWTYTYDTYGRLEEFGQGARYKTTLTYGTNGFVTKIKNAMNQETFFTTDNAGRVTSQTLPDSRVVQYEYDASGNLTGVTPPSRPKHIFEFNLFDGVSKYTPPALTGVSPVHTDYTYNTDKQLAQVTRPDGKTIQYTYDVGTGLLTGMTTAVGSYGVSYYSSSPKPQALGSAYGIKDVLTYYGTKIKSDEQRRRSDDAVFGKVAWEFNSMHLPTSRTVTGSSAGSSLVPYVYNSDFVPTTVGDMTLEYQTNTGRLLKTKINKIEDERTYDANGDLSGYSSQYDSTLSFFTTIPLYSYTLTRDDLGRITQKVETILGTTVTWGYEYDSAGRLTKVTKNSAVYSEYTYDGNGNRTSGKTAGTNFTATYDNQDRLLTYNTRTYSYNKNGDLSQIQWNTSTTSSYQYDAFGNPLQFTTSGGVVYDYINDSFHRLAGRKQGATVSHRYIYEDQYRVAAQLNGSGVLQKSFIYATGGTSPDYMTNTAGTFRIIKDHLGSPRLVVNTADGTVVQQIDYNDLGEITNDTNPNYQPFAFAGGIYDQNSKFVRFGARDYDPRAGRWTTKDPILFAGGDTNLFSYVANDPVNLIDPSGNCPWCFGAVVGGVAAGVATYIANPNASLSTIATSAAVGAVAGAASSGLSATASLGVIFGANAGIGYAANVATQVATGTSLGQINQSSALIAGLAGGIGGIVGLGAGTAAFYATPVIGNAVGTGAASAARMCTGTLTSATVGTVGGAFGN